MLLVKYITDTFGQRRLRDNGPEWVFPDFCAKGTTRLFTDIKLARYIFSAYRNQENYEPDDNTIAGVKENNDEDLGGGLPNNAYEFYNIYN